MKSTQALTADHEIILRALHVLDVITTEFKLGHTVSRQDADALILFLNDFADSCHDVKEEAIFLPALMQAGMSLKDGPLAIMAYEHERGRALLAAMREALERNNKDEFILYAGRYGQLVMEHIQKENYILFEKADEILTDDLDQKIIEAFERFDHTTVGMPARTRLFQTLETLAWKYGGVAVG